MASKILDELKREIGKLESELKILVHAANLIAEASSTRGRKAKVTTKADSIISTLGKGSNASKIAKGKRGRPKGSTNKPGSKKPGPKTGQSTAPKAVVQKPKGKRGPKPKAKPEA